MATTHDARPVRWGVAGPGGIARRFARGLRHAGGGEIVAIASRSPERAEAFRRELELDARCCGYDDLASDDVDAVYVATPHSYHHADTMAAIAAGKHVLCEKPMALDAAQAAEMVAAARSAGVFLMEAIWSRFLPAYVRLRELLDGGRIGEPRFVEASFGFRAPLDAEHRLFDVRQGGGALLDLGIYPLQLSTFVLGPVEHVAAVASIGSTGVDEQVAAVLRHGRGGLGVVEAAVRTALPCTARISGTEGWVDLPAPMHFPTSLSVAAGGAPGVVVDGAFDGDGLQFEIAEVHRCLAEGRLESDVMPLDESVALAVVMDDVRAQIGLAYPHPSR